MSLWASELAPVEPRDESCEPESDDDVELSNDCGRCGLSGSIVGTYCEHCWTRTED